MQSYGLPGDSSLYATYGDGASCIACSPSVETVLNILIAFEDLAR